MKRLFVLLALCISAAASERLTLQVENDVFFSEDDGYTHGTRLTYTSPDLRIGDVYEASAVLGQYIYTPRSIAEYELIEDDRAYGGWLYAGYLVDMRNANAQNLIELDVGITGDASYAEETQRQVHEWIDSQLPNGWDNQVKQEVGVNLNMQRKYRYRIGRTWSADAIPSFGGAIGTVFLHLDSGLMLRAGYNVPYDFGQLMMEPVARDACPYSVYLFSGVNGKMVMHNLFLDGGTFRNSHSVTRERWVGEANAGVCLAYEEFRLAYYIAVRSCEYAEQDHCERFGGVSLTWSF